MILAACLQVTCMNVRSYGLVTMPSSLPTSLETVWVGTRARGRRIGASLLMPKASDLPNIKVYLLALHQLSLYLMIAVPCQGSLALARNLASCMS